nr:hypothetical protein [uncultured Flavobacterium sp.]
MKNYYLTLLFLGVVYYGYGQVGIGTTLPNTSSELDVVSGNKGILIPRVSLTSTIDAITITNGNVNSLLVFNTQTIADITPGYYYWYVNKWYRLGTSVSETVTTLIDNGDGTITYTNESGTPVTINVPKGVQGAAGTNGTNGIDGAVGATGPQGPIGLTGTAGANGTNGTNGIDGAVGATGPQGPIGLTGPAGANGTDGIDGAVGATGPQGPIGLTGPAGANGTDGIDGAVGATGPQGPIGLTGLAGANGTNGIDGATGPQGPIGLTGPAGANGTNGIDGATGPQGPIGLTGPAGANGTNGIDGAVGAAGPQGPIGLTGPAGANGTDGIDGAVGAAGPQGPIGLTGLAGTNGANGIDGAVGATGPQGPAGTNGVGGVTTAGTNITITGAGTVASPYIVNASSPTQNNTTLALDTTTNILTYTNENSDNPTIDLSNLKVEPWLVQTTTDKATLNTENIYQMGTVAIGKNEALADVALDVQGALHVGSNHAGSVGLNSAAIGDNITVRAENSVGIGNQNEIYSQDALIVGRNNLIGVVGFANAIFGSDNKEYNAGGIWVNNTIFGANNTMTGEEGGPTLSNNTIFGEKNTITSIGSGAIIYNNTLFGNNNYSGISSSNSTIFGEYNISDSYNQFIIGKANRNINGSIFEIGIGADASNRANALTVIPNGNVGISNEAVNPTEKLDIGSGNVRVRNINTNTGTANDNIVVADINGVLKTVAVADLSLEPWQIENTTDKATTNSQNIYQMGNIGIKTNAPNSTLTINGSANNLLAYDAGTDTTIDYSQSNLAYTTADAGNTFDLQNIKDGGTYTLAVQGSVSGTANFTSAGFTVHLPVDNGPSVVTGGKHSIYTILVLGTHVYMSWITGL